MLGPWAVGMSPPTSPIVHLGILKIFMGLGVTLVTSHLWPTVWASIWVTMGSVRLSFIEAPRQMWRLIRVVQRESLGGFLCGCAGEQPRICGCHRGAWKGHALGADDSYDKSGLATFPGGFVIRWRASTLSGSPNSCADIPIALRKMGSSLYQVRIGHFFCFPTSMDHRERLSVLFGSHRYGAIFFL